MKNNLIKQMVFASFLILFTAASAFAQDACEGNFDCDLDVDGTDAAVFKTDFGRSQFKNPCPPCAAPLAALPETGQTVCFNQLGTVIPCLNTGQDGDLRRGVAWPAPRFTDNANGTVTDNLTGLIWLKNTNCFGPRTWNQALSDSNGLVSGQCSLTDGSLAGAWRLPNRKELESVLDLGRFNPALPSGHPFSGVQLNTYWSSTTSESDTGSAWVVFMDNGDVGDDAKTLTSFVWPVKGGL